MTIRIASSPSDFGKSVVKSIDIDFHGRFGASFALIRPYGAFRTTLVLCHVSQFLTYCFIVFRICGH